MPNGRSDWAWRPTATRRARRHDDIWFFDENVGWAVNSDGKVIKTENGGALWENKFSVFGDSVWLRCLGFADTKRGWVGTTTTGKRLYETSDGGEKWNNVTNLPAEAPSAICGLFVASDSVIYAAGTNWPDRSTGIIKSDDGGTTWSGMTMNDQAAILVDIYFRNEQEGWVVGAKSSVANPTREDVEAIVLFTDDGGKSWRETKINSQLPKGEWGWKIFFVTDEIGYVSLENFTDGAILKTTDAGQSWVRHHINDEQDNMNLEGIGFIDEENGWVGGWGNSSRTSDGAENWQDANEIGRFINRFRFIGDPVHCGFASGEHVYKYTSEAESPFAELLEEDVGLLQSDSPTETERPLTIRLNVPNGAKRLMIDVWDRFSAHVCKLIDEDAPESGARTLIWDCISDDGQRVNEGFYCYRVVVDDEAESRFVQIGAKPG